jgi:hypothetical protein
MSGIAETWIGVGSSNPISDIDFIVSLLRLKSSKFILFPSYVFIS